MPIGNLQQGTWVKKKAEIVSLSAKKQHFTSRMHPELKYAIGVHRGSTQGCEWCAAPCSIPGGQVGNGGNHQISPGWGISDPKSPVLPSLPGDCFRLAAPATIALAEVGG